MQDASSIDQQQRKCRDRAEQDGMNILPELQFADEAVSGTKREREGLNAMLDAARAGRFGIVYFESLSRLARESVITMPMLKELVYVCRIRIVSVSEGIDSAQNNWELLASFMAWTHEQYVKNLRSAVLRGQEDALLNDYSVGDLCLGYGSEPIPGSENRSKSRHMKPRKRVIIIESHALCVRQIFEWFVVDGRKIGWIARELTRLKAPKDHRSTNPSWHRDSVKTVLHNRKYIGIWPWGEMTNVRNPLTGQVTQEARSPEEAAKWVRERPHLRIIDDQTFFSAQVRLDELKEKWASVRRDNGQLSGSERDAHSPRHLLQGLIRCGACGRTFQVMGANGKYLGCSGYYRGHCACKTRLSRQLAEQRLLAAFGDRVLRDPIWLDAVVQEACRAWSDCQAQEPAAIAEVERQLTAVSQKINRLLDAVERGDNEVDELNERLRQRRDEKKQLELQRARLKTTTGQQADPPKEEWIKARLQHLEELIQSRNEQANDVLRKLVGGQVVVNEATTEGRKRKHLVGEFTFSTRTILAGITNAVAQQEVEPALSSEEVTIIFRADPPWAAIADAVKERFDAGVEFARIAEELNCSRSWVAKALAWWHRNHGLPPRDGRGCRKRLRKPNKAQRLADAAKKLWDAGLSMKEIAERLNTHRDAITAAIGYWHRSRNLPLPDGRRRRKELGKAPNEANIVTG